MVRQNRKLRADSAHRRLAALAFALALGLLLPGRASAIKELLPGDPEAPQPTFSASATSVPSGGTFEIRAHFRFEDIRVKLYKDKLRFIWDRLEGAQVEEVVLPPGSREADRLSDKPGATIEVYYGAVTATARLRATAPPGGAIIVRGRLEHQSCTNQVCFPPAEGKFDFALTATAATGAGLLVLILGGFLAGLAMSMTPCMYPMIPITAAIIGARRERGLVSALAASALYVLGLSLVYAGAGVILAKVGSGAATFLASAWVKVPVAGIFVALAVVMFAGLNFAAPSGLASRLQNTLAGRKGLAATFALGAVSGLVAGPCIAAPISGILLYIATRGSSVVGFWMLFAAAWGMGVPLLVFGAATGLLPRAGEWMDWFKRLIGFVLVWAALYFLSTLIGDAAYRLAFGVLLIAAAVFLGGFDALTRDSSFGDRLKKVLGVVAVLYAAVLIISTIAGGAARPRTGGDRTAPVEEQTLFAAGSARDVDDAIAAHEPVVIDFYADWCDNCKVLDKEVYSRPEARAAAAGLRAVKIDIDKEPALAKRYNVFRPPAVVFVGRDGRERADLSFAGEKSLDEFVALLKKMKEPGAP